MTESLDLFEPNLRNYPGEGATIKDGESYMVWRYGLTNPALHAFYAKSGVKELIRAEVLDNPVRVMGQHKGKIEYAPALFERVYGEPAEVKVAAKARRK